MTGPSRIDWLTDLGKIEALREEWLALEATVRQRTVFSTYDWVVLWYRHYCPLRGTPLLGVARNGSRVAGIAPLVAWRGTLGRVPVRRVDFAGHTSDAGEFLVRDDAPEVVGHLLESLLDVRGFDAVCLNGLPRASSAFRVLSETAERQGLVLELLDSRYAVADLSSGYEAYLRSRSQNFRHQHKRVARRIAAVGKPRVDRLRTSGSRQEVSAFLGRMFAIAASSWKARESGPMAEHHRRFYEEVAVRFASKGMLDLSILSVGSRDAAFVLALVDRDIYYDVNIAFDASFEGVSPGYYLMQDVLRGCAETGIGTVVSHGDHDYKRRWATAFVTRSSVFIFCGGWKARLSRLMKFELPRAVGRARAELCTRDMPGEPRPEDPDARP